MMGSSLIIQLTLLVLSVISAAKEVALDDSKVVGSAALYQSAAMKEASEAFQAEATLRNYVRCGAAVCPDPSNADYVQSVLASEPPLTPPEGFRRGRMGEPAVYHFRDEQNDSARFRQAPQVVLPSQPGFPADAQLPYDPQAVSNQAPQPYPAQLYPSQAYPYPQPVAAGNQPCGLSWCPQETPCEPEDHPRCRRRRRRPVGNSLMLRNLKKMEERERKEEARREQELERMRDELRSQLAQKQIVDEATSGLRRQLYKIQETKRQLFNQLEMTRTALDVNEMPEDGADQYNPEKASKNVLGAMGEMLKAQRHILAKSHMEQKLNVIHHNRAFNKLLGASSDNAEKAVKEADKAGPKKSKKTKDDDENKDEDSDTDAL